MVGVPGLWDILGAVGTVFTLSHLHLALTSGKAVQLHLRTRVCERREREPLTPWPAVIEASGTQTQSGLGFMAPGWGRGAGFSMRRKAWTLGRGSGFLPPPHQL